jgi:hypothetical protein
MPPDEFAFKAGVTAVLESSSTCFVVFGGDQARTHYHVEGIAFYGSNHQYFSGNLSMECRTLKVTNEHPVRKVRDRLRTDRDRLSLRPLAEMIAAEQEWYAWRDSYLQEQAKGDCPTPWIDRDEDRRFNDREGDHSIEPFFPEVDE